jgi:hypothetical protein
VGHDLAVPLFRGFARNGDPNKSGEFIWKGVRMRYSIVLCGVAVFLLVCGSSVAWSPYGNESVPPTKAQGDSPQLPFDPNDYNFLIYDCNGSEDSIDAAMQKIGIDTYTVCDADNPVTANLLANHDILIVSWSNGGGNKSGLATSVIEQGITGRVILSGHDSDYHTVNGTQTATNFAEIFFIQEIDFVLKGSGTGMIVCADVDSNFAWLPESWGVESEAGGGSTVSTITQDGVDSGVYDGLTKKLSQNR